MYPRVILQRALACNAGSIIAYHNHPNVAEATMLRRFRFAARDGEATRFTAT